MSAEASEGQREAMLERGDEQEAQERMKCVLVNGKDSSRQSTDTNTGAPVETLHSTRIPVQISTC